MLTTDMFVTYLTFIAVHASVIPMIGIRGPRIAIEYDKIHLTCSILNEHKHFQWYFSANASNAFNAHYKLLTAHPFSVIRLNSNQTTLTIRSVEKSHVGNYRCCASETVCTGTYLSVLSVLDNQLKLGPTTYHTAAGSSVLDVPNRGNFSIALYHSPLIGAEVYIERGPTVSLCDHFRMHARECDEHRTSDTLSYAVRNVTQQDGGQFDVRIHFNGQVERFHLHILVKGSPTVQMDNYSVLNSADHVSFLCGGFAYPAPNVTFTYTPCSPTKMDHLPTSNHSAFCGKSITLPEHFVKHSRLYHRTFFEAIVPSWPVAYGPGIVSCQAANSEGTAAISTLLYVRNFHDPMLFRVVSPADVVLYGDSVNITCQVDVYNFTNQFTIHHGGESSQLTGRRHQYAWTVTYMAHITNGSHNEVSCVATHRDGTVLENTRNLSIQYPSKPHIVSVNDTVNVTIPSEVYLRLECDIVGTPTPYIVWFKNDEHLKHEQGHFIRIVLELDERYATYKCLGTSRLGRTTKTWYIVQEDSMQWLLVGGVGIGVFLALLSIAGVVWAVQAY